MSLRYWNSLAERARLCRLMTLSAILLEEDSDDEDGMSVDSSLSLESGQSLVSFLSLGLFDGDHSISASSSSDCSTVDFVVGRTIRFAQYVYNPIVESEINFEKKHLLIKDLDESKCLLDFRFRKEDLQDIADRLWPKVGMVLEGDKNRIQCANKYTCPYETGILLCLFRLSRPRRLRPEMERYFSMRKSHISAVISTFMMGLFQVSQPYLSNPSIFKNRFAFYNGLIERKAGLANLGVWGFIDGTLRRTCRPSMFQRLVYSGHKRCHGIKFQSVVTPDGLIAILFGPIPGSRHDSFMLAQSGLLPLLEEAMPADGSGGPIFALYGDAAYPQSPYLFGGFRGVQPGSNRAKWNTKMSRVREVVEWLYKEIITNWAFLDFKAGMKIFQFPVAQYYTVGAFFTNLHTCCYGSETSHYFSCAETVNGRLTLEQYLALVP